MTYKERVRWQYTDGRWSCYMFQMKKRRDLTSDLIYPWTAAPAPSTY